MAQEGRIRGEKQVLRICFERLWLHREKVSDFNSTDFQVSHWIQIGESGHVGNEMSSARSLFAIQNEDRAGDEGCMDMSDQIISSRPKDQTCQLAFEPTATREWGWHMRNPPPDAQQGHRDLFSSPAPPLSNESIIPNAYPTPPREDRRENLSPYSSHRYTQSDQSSGRIPSLYHSRSTSAITGRTQPTVESSRGAESDDESTIAPSLSILSRSGEARKPVVRKILSLDGGGVKGLSTIFILQSLMYSLGRERGKKLEPWQEFDLIGGTSTGGLLAIMLGRLRMSLDDCQDAYLNLSERIFQPVRSSANVAGRLVDFVQANGKFDASRLEECVKQILKDQGKKESELLKEDDTDTCKVFVCAVTGFESTAVIRSYETDNYDRLLDVCKIWEAARATSAASTLFEPISIGRPPTRFVDGALKHNNPINLADIEASTLWPNDDKLIVSVGTGVGPSGAVTGNLKDLIETLKRIATDTEEKNDLFQKQHPSMLEHGRLFRFNVFRGLEQVGLAEHEAVERITDFTQQYLNLQATRSDIKRCINSMLEGEQRLNIMGQQG
ncbi:MAG: hypothetical protein M1813_007238 [Trichoglossum hirsutum]|nr:MAG: hypothetical protein M1813_007238 [Trichoglossum hirsutum]